MNGLAHVFDIRFARSSGFAAFLVAPENTFRWKGRGTLQIDAAGVSIAVRRGLLAPFASKRTRRIAAGDLTNVYRERDALRLEFNAPGDLRGVVPFWARDRETAAEIVRLLPTQRTVEIEEALASAPGRPRMDGRLMATVLMSLVAVAIGVATLLRRLPAPAAREVIATPVEIPARIATQPAPGALTLPFPVPLKAVNSPSAALDDIISASTRVAKTPSTREFRIFRVQATDGVIPYVSSEPAYERARAQLDFFLRTSLVLQEDFFYGRRPMSEIELRWWELTQSLYNSEEFDDHSLRPLIDAELAASQNWRGALMLYREATASGNARDLATARELVELANYITDRVSLYVN